MSIKELSEENFFVFGNKRKTLNITYPGNILILFKDDRSNPCKAFEPIFKNLSINDRRIEYGIINLTKYINIAKISRDTVMPINKVPQLIMYIPSDDGKYGRPFARFRGKKNIDELRKFITNALSQIPSIQTGPPPSNSFVNQNMPQPQPQPQAMPQPTQLQQQPIQHTSMQQQCDPEPEEDIQSWKDIIPHNQPWEADYKMLSQ